MGHFGRKDGIPTRTAVFSGFNIKCHDFLFVFLVSGDENNSDEDETSSINHNSDASLHSTPQQQNSDDDDEVVDSDSDSDEGTCWVCPHFPLLLPPPPSQ